MNQSETERFLDFVDRLVACTDVAGVQLGVVYTTDEDPRVLSLHAELVEQAGPTEPRRFAADAIGAFSCVGGIAELRSLARQLDDGSLQEFCAPIHHTALAVLDHQPTYLAENTYPSRNLGLSVVRSATLLRRVDNTATLEMQRAIDRAIATQSSYEIATLRRLMVQFGALAGADDQTIALVARWPIFELTAALEGPRLTVQVTGLRGIHPGRIILNAESEDADWRISTASFEPAETAGSSGTIANRRARYVATIHDLPAIPRAIHAYYQGLDEVWLQHPLPQPDQPALERPARPSPVSRIEAPEADEGVAGSMPRLAKLHVEGFRSLRDVTLALSPLSVIIGPNQAGKSSLLDALDVLAASARGSLYDAVVRRRGGFQRLVWRGPGPRCIQLDAELTLAGDQALRYEIVLGPVGVQDYAVKEERILARRNGQWHPLLAVSGGEAVHAGTAYASDDPRETLLSQVRRIPGIPALERIRTALASMALYPGFETGALWGEPEGAGMRAPARPEPGTRLLPRGANLVAALHALRDEHPDIWKEYLAIVRLAFPSLEDIRTPPALRGYVQLAWQDQRFEHGFDAEDLSDGTLAYLACLCALMQPGHGLVAIDEPECHLHPDALYRLIGAARMMSARRPILLTTQSDRLIGFLDDIPESVVVARAGEAGTELVRPDKDDLEHWLAGFSLADIRHELETRFRCAPGLC